MAKSQRRVVMDKLSSSVKRLSQDWSLLFWVKSSSWIGVENEHLYSIKEEPTWRQNSSRLGKCQGQFA